MKPIRIALASLALAALLSPGGALAATLKYVATLNGANEAPANASPGFGSAELTVHGNSYRLVVNFADLIGNVTAAHIHGPTAVAGAGTAGVMTPVPTYPGFPGAVTSGSYDRTFDLTDTTTFNAGFLTLHGGSAAAAAAAFLASLNAGTAYLNIHTMTFPGGEIRGFFAPAQVPLPAGLPLLVCALAGLAAVRRRR